MYTFLSEAYGTFFSFMKSIKPLIERHTSPPDGFSELFLRSPLSIPYRAEVLRYE